ncbi:hypothetical protein B0H11DRAFT_1910182 [Mycena galericulata]|nr:hypothetical protein B0H11DRAFT_1910182 [Mycena galericulata]
MSCVTVLCTNFSLGMLNTSRNLTTDICPLCKSQYLQFPTECRGRYCLANRGRLYQACGDNNFDDTSCHGFVWCSPSHPGASGIDDMHSSPGSSSGPQNPSPTRRPSAPCHQHGCKLLGNVACVQKFCKTCCLDSSVVCPAPRHNYQAPVEHQPQHVTSHSLPVPQVPLVYAKPFAKPISPIYAAKLLHGDFTVNHNQDRAQVEAYRVMAERQIKCYWFAKDNTPPHAFACAIPNAPYFHPRDDVAITTVIGKDKCNPYSVLVGVDWITTAAAQRVKANDTLCFRSLDVTNCVGGPFASAPTPKRRLSEATDGHSPSKITRRSSIHSISGETGHLRPTAAAKLRDEVIDDEDGSSRATALPESPSPSPKPQRPFPLKWACTVPGRFAQAFLGAKWASSTYYPHKKAWDSVRDDPMQKAKLTDAVTIGKGPGGEWHPFFKLYNPYHECVEKHSATLANLQASHIRFSCLASVLTLPPKELIVCIHDQAAKKTRPPKPTSTVEAIEIIGNAQAKLDWNLVVNPPDQTEEITLEGLMENLVAGGTFFVPQDVLVVPFKKDKLAVNTCKVRYKDDWEEGKTWKYIIFDSKVDVTELTPQVILLDYTNAFTTEDLVVMHRFNNLPLFVEETIPTHLDPGQIAPEEATTYSVRTSAVLNAVLRQFVPSNADHPFYLCSGLSGYDTETTELLYFEKGYTKVSKNPLKKAMWLRDTEVRMHYLPAIGPRNALRILILLISVPGPADPEAAAAIASIKGKGTPAEPVAGQIGAAAVPGAVPTAAVGVVPAPSTASASVTLTKGAKFLVGKYGTRTSIVAMRASEKSKVPQPITVLVQWVTDIEEILRKHLGQKIPIADTRKASNKPAKKFVQKDFEILFARRINWLMTCQTAAGAIRDQRRNFEAEEDATKLAAFNLFLANDERKKGVGIQSLLMRVENFGEVDEDDDDEGDENKTDEGPKDDEDQDGSDKDEEGGKENDSSDMEED